MLDHISHVIEQSSPYQEEFMISEKIIQRSLFNFYDSRNHKLIVPNIYLHYSEADLITVQKSGYVNEIEIKLTKSDFKRDFKKRKHMYMAESMKPKTRFRNLHTPNYFWFCFPDALRNKIDFDIPNEYGMIVVDENGDNPVILKRAAMMHKNKVTEKQVRQIARSLMYKMWNRPAI